MTHPQHSAALLNQRHSALQPLPMLIVSAVALTVIGLVMIASASMDVAGATYGNSYHFLFRQLLFVAMASVLALVAVNVPMAWWQGSSWLLLGLGLLVLALVLTPLGRTVNGATRWIPLGIFNIQVSEIAKLCLVGYLASYLVRRRDELLNTWFGFIKPVLVLIAAAALLMVQPDFGATVVLIGAAGGMIFLSGVRLTRFAPLVGLVAAFGVLAIMLEPYRMKRVVSYLDPWQDQFNSGYQLTQSLIAFGRGEWAGVGLGNSIQKLFFLPEAHTDFIFAIIAEEFGVIGALVVVALFTVLVLSGFVIARRAEQAKQPFAACLAYGLSLLIGLQAVINMAVATGLLPTKGLTLPLVSYGGSSLMITCVCLGMLARIEMERLDAATAAAVPQAKKRRAGAAYD